MSASIRDVANPTLVNFLVGLLLLFRYSATSSTTASGYFTLNGDMAPPAARDSSEVACVKTGAVILKPETVGSLWYWSSSPSLSVGFPTEDEGMDVARSAPQEVHYTCTLNCELKGSK